MIAISAIKAEHAARQEWIPENSIATVA